MDLVFKDKFDSEDEEHFAHWLREAHSLGLVVSARPPEQYQLAPPVWTTITKEYETKVQKIKRVKKVKRNVLAAVRYTPDFEFVALRDLWALFDLTSFDTLLHYPKDRPSGSYCMIVDVKPAYKRAFATGRSFPILRKWLWDAQGIFIEEVTTAKFFKETWVPDNVRKGKRVETLAPWKGYRTFDEAKAIVGVGMEGE